MDFILNTLVELRRSFLSKYTSYSTKGNCTDQAANERDWYHDLTDKETNNTPRRCPHQTTRHFNSIFLCSSSELFFRDFALLELSEFDTSLSSQDRRS